MVAHISNLSRAEFQLRVDPSEFSIFQFKANFGQTGYIFAGPSILALSQIQSVYGAPTKYCYRHQTMNFVGPVGPTSNHRWLLTLTRRRRSSPAAIWMTSSGTGAYQSVASITVVCDGTAPRVRTGTGGHVTIGDRKAVTWVCWYREK